ncbi:MAG: hypothetical protein HQL13_06005, partial [Candidatus Omnitrophica bacterium]|nr:hypothetical protein [Candidatus Omnitrophota bacterium]
MKIKKIILGILVLMGVSILWADSSCATTWYVRDGGGNATQCTGTTNAIYPGSGTNQPCAFNHPRYVLGWGCGNNGSNNPCTGKNPVMGQGDALYISGDSDINPGTQAQYEIGYDDTGKNLTPGCSSAYPYDCTLGNIPAGISPTQLTIVKGTGAHQPQLWGTQRVWSVLSADSGNLDLENVEITQHSACVEQGGDPNGTVDGFPAVCVQSTYPYGPWAPNGIYLQGTNITTANLYIHGMAHTSIYFPGNVANWNSTNDRFIAAGWFHTDGPNMTFSGNNTQTNDVWAFGGCGEHYPMPDPGNIKNVANYHHCCDQNCGALGGGFMMQNNGNASCGNWTITNSQFLYNLKTNIDFLHCNGTGTFNIYKSRSEGSNGEALKLNVASANIENSQMIGNAAVWTTAPFKAILSPYSISGTAYSPLLCRGNNGTVFASTNGAVVNFLNSDISGNCTDLIGLSGSNSCSTNPQFNIYNSKLVAGYALDLVNSSPGFVNLFFNSSSCAATVNEDYNSMSN